MTRKDDLKKIERRARALLISKDIPPHKQEVVRTLMNNQRLMPDEKYRTIIELLQSCPDRKVTLIPDEGVKPEPARKKKGVPVAGVPSRPAVALFAPTETSYYVDDLLNTYAGLKIFRRRWLVHRNNRVGVGMRKRLIPTRHFMKIMKYLADIQGMLTGRLAVIMMEILKDPAVDDPAIFNHIRAIRKWLAEVPFVQLKYDFIKWMERVQFERELKNWVSSYFSFIKLDGEMKEKILAEAESRVRLLDDLKKEEYIDGEPDQYRRDKERRNLEKEKQIYEFMMMMRSYIPVDTAQEVPLSKNLKQQYGIGSLANFLMATLEALVFQRPTRQEDVAAYFAVGAPLVSREVWDYSEDFLQKVGKDPESLQKKSREALRKVIEPYEMLATLLRFDENGRNLLLKGVEDQWRVVDKKHHDAKIMYNENFMNFLDALLQYFKNMYVPLLEGSAIKFRDMGRQEFEGSIFAFNYFESHLAIFEKILYEMHHVKTNNPTLALTRDDVKKLLKGQPGQLAHIARFIQSIGDCFYLIGKELQTVYEQHRRWVAGRTQVAGVEPARESLKDRALNENSEWGRPIPYHDCVIIGIENGTALTKELAGQRVLDDTLRDGVYVHMNAFAYQVSYECSSERLARDIEERKKLLKKIEEAPK